ncbi:hypothetical protein SADUNF_Sadunf01G0098200 [Salix dunnii]|uniref:Uncharacterized protein n=1 Tax=Salix dunnii TaxID=1413687 RepID=A0A835NAZ7_9ROSI|nr:hypothetical protein SADUNF_Sadunf01G0098200 [Salix dunnii]
MLELQAFHASSSSVLADKYVVLSRFAGFDPILHLNAFSLPVVQSLPHVFLMCTCTCFPDSTCFSVLFCLMQHEHLDSLSQGLVVEVILDEAIVRLNPDIFWLGGREVSLKLAIRTLEFIDFVKPSVASCSGTTVMVFEVVETSAVHIIGSWNLNSVGRSLDL